MNCTYNIVTTRWLVLDHHKKKKKKTVAVLAPVCTHNHKFLFRALLFGLEEDVKRGMALGQSTTRFTGTRTPVSDRTHDPNVRTSTVLYCTVPTQYRTS